VWRSITVKRSCGRAVDIKGFVSVPVGKRAKDYLLDV